MDNDKIDLALERFYSKFNKYNSSVLELFGKTISKFEGLSSTEAHRLARQLKNGRDINEIIQQLVKLSGLSKKEVIEILEITAKQNIDFAKPYYEYRNIENSFKKSKEFQDIVKSVAILTNDTFENIAKTTCIKLLDKYDRPMYLDIKKAYNEVIDRSVLAVTTGQQDFKSAMRDTVKQLADSGVKKVYYENKKPYARRLDSTVRQNLLSGIKQINLETQKRIGEEIGADGIEISAHSNPAPDHEEVQGRIFTKEEFNKFQNDTDAKDINGNLFTADFEEHDRRSIEEYNCQHVPFEIIIGVNEPQWTKVQLDKMIKDNHKGFEFEGKHYTMYEGEQLQRSLELKIRQNKDRQIIAKAENDIEVVDKTQKNIILLNGKYNELSKISGLPTRKERMVVADYKRIKTGIVHNKLTDKQINYINKNKKLIHSTNKIRDILESKKLLYDKTDIGLYDKETTPSNYGDYYINLKPKILDGDMKIYIGDGGTRNEKYISEKKTTYSSLNSALYNSKKGKYPYDQINVFKDINLSSIKYIDIPENTPKDIIEALEYHKIKYNFYKLKPKNNTDESSLIKMLEKNKK